MTRTRLSIERARTSLHTRPSGLSAVALGFSIVYLVLIPPYLSSVDGNSMFAVAKSLAVHGNASVPCNLSGAPPGVVGSGGECYSAWYPLISFLAVPLIVLGRIVAATVGVDTSYAEEELALVIPALAAAGAATVCAAIARKLGASRRGAVLAALAAGLGTEMLTYARYFFAETTAAFLVALGVWGLTESGRRRMIALFSLGLAVLAKPPMIVIGPALGAALAIRSRNWRRLLPPTSASALGASVYLLYNWLRFGDPMQFGGGDRFDVGNYFSPDLFKIIGLLLISPGKGLLWFSPVAVLGALALWRHSRSETGMLCVAGAVGVLVVYIGYPYGGWDWGGRFLVPAIPLLCAALGSLRGRIAVVAITLAAVAAVMQIPTIIAPYERAYAEARQDGIYLEGERWTPSESPLVLMWPAMVHQIRAARGGGVNEPPGTTAKSSGGLDNQIFKVVGLWWWRPRSGGFRPFGLIVSFAAVVIAGRLLRRGTFASSRGN